MDTISTKLNPNNLLKQLKEIEIMKRILFLKNYDCSYEFLKSQIDTLCHDNFIYFVALNNYLFQMPDKVKQDIEDIIRQKDDKESYKNLFDNYLNKFKTNQTFKEYESYIFVQRSQEAIKYFNNSSDDNIELETFVISIKRIQMALIFNILKDKTLPEDFVQNLPMLALWIKDNREKPIKNLTEKEAKIIASLICGVPHIYNSNIFNSISDKFGVDNITQAVFRIFLLKPHIWNNTNYYDLVKSVEGVCDEV